MDSQYYHFDSYLIDPSETVKLSGQILKINKRNKSQQRIFVLTDKAIYNIKPKNNNIQRRIDLLSISSITTSSKSTEFTINIPSEYDYHFDAVNEQLQHKIIFEISKQITNLEHQIFINQINDISTDKWTVTKKVLKMINSHHNETVRTVMALDYLIAMGFKSKIAFKTLKQNEINLSLAMQSLISKPVRSSFVSKVHTPVITKVNCDFVGLDNFKSAQGNQIGPTLSFTEEVNDYFALKMTK
eukprot:311226_1